MTEQPPGPPAPAERRLYAFAVDRAIAGLVYAGAGGAAWRLWLADGRVVPGASSLAGIVLIVVLVYALMAATGGTSPGKAALGLRLAPAGTGSEISVGAALARAAIVELATFPTFGLGAATLAWTAATDPHGRGWHDRVAGTIVIDPRSRPVAAPPMPAPVADRVINLTAQRLLPQAPDTGSGDSAPVVPPPAEAEATARLAGPPSRRWRLRFDSGEDVVVEGLGLIGRHPEPRDGEPVRHLVPLRSGDLSLSKTHAQFQLADGVLVMTDRGSTNGTMLIRQGAARPLSRGTPTALADGDRVQLGDREMLVSRPPG